MLESLTLSSAFTCSQRRHVPPKRLESNATQVLVLPMLAPRSYTREDVVEVHCHGGSLCSARVLAAAVALGARPAGAGEFTLRAFLAGRIDLAQAEAVQVRTHAPLRSPSPNLTSPIL